MSVTPIRELKTSTSAVPEKLAHRLEDPEIVDALDTLLAHADLLALLVEGINGLAERGDTITETLAEGLTELRTTVESTPGADDLDIRELTESAVLLAGAAPKAVPGMLAFVDSGIIDRLIDSEILSPAAVDEVSRLSRGVVRGSADYRADPHRIDGPRAMFKAMRDPDVTRALSYLLTVAKAIGRELNAPATPPTSRNAASPGLR
ncbi:hypothetical protein BJY21_001385 [Kineosphaera limosa]|uniref:DUF1641 domain-containing protein n=1 Tax=Kineosphaera limosa NBRC 100340 TaxID=1184609 RepID=K6WFS8_9MICO|nr:DUF1641 domain-containing protein [Kineosphaera limosa]NYE00201.1 hypothetical protein [Kineosphaera limosa]GAB98150.1 hypothetical protein KILIM_105_00060 [Kineosphaera limosa NBRC 100340]